MISSFCWGDATELRGKGRRWGERERRDDGGELTGSLSSSKFRSVLTHVDSSFLRGCRRRKERRNRERESEGVKAEGRRCELGREEMADREDGLNEPAGRNLRPESMGKEEGKLLNI